MNPVLGVWLDIDRHIIIIVVVVVFLLVVVVIILMMLLMIGWHWPSWTSGPTRIEWRSRLYWASGRGCE